MWSATSSLWLATAPQLDIVYDRIDDGRIFQQSLLMIQTIIPFPDRRSYHEELVDRTIKIRTIPPCVAAALWRASVAICVACPWASFSSPSGALPACFLFPAPGALPALPAPGALPAFCRRLHELGGTTRGTSSWSFGVGGSGGGVGGRLLRGGSGAGVLSAGVLSLCRKFVETAESAWLA